MNINTNINKLSFAFGLSREEMVTANSIPAIVEFNEQVINAQKKAFRETMDVKTYPIRQKIRSKLTGPIAEDKMVWGALNPKLHDAIAGAITWGTDGILFGQTSTIELTLESINNDPNAFAEKVNQYWFNAETNSLHALAKIHVINSKAEIGPEGAKKPGVIYIFELLPPIN